MVMTEPWQKQVERVVELLRRELASSLVAVYLHGSAVSGGLRPGSDIDLLAVAENPFSPEIAAELTRGLMELSEYPSGGNTLRPVELIIFLRGELAVPAYPAQGAFVYGEWLRGSFEAGNIPTPGADPELTLVLAQARREAAPLFGPGAEELLPVIPCRDIRRAIGDVLPALLASLRGDERNVVLTLARMWRTLATGEFVSKDAAAEWALERLPEEHAPLLAAMRAAYLGDSASHYREREVSRAVEWLRERILRELS